MLRVKQTDCWGGGQGTYVLAEDGYRRRDNLKEHDGSDVDLINFMKESFIKQTEKFVSKNTGKDATNCVGVTFEHEMPTSMTQHQIKEDLIATKGVTTTTRIASAFIKNMGARVIQGFKYAQTAYPEPGAEAIDNDGAADYLIQTGIFPKDKPPTNYWLNDQIQKVAGVLATDNGRFSVKDHDVIRRMEKDLIGDGQVRMMPLVDLRPELKALQMLMDDTDKNFEMGTKETYGERLGIPPMWSPNFQIAMAPYVAKYGTAPVVAAKTPLTQKDLTTVLRSISLEGAIPNRLSVVERNEFNDRFKGKLSVVASTSDERQLHDVLVKLILDDDFYAAHKANLPKEFKDYRVEMQGNRSFFKGVQAYDPRPELGL